jgi:hypothetical protein
MIGSHHSFKRDTPKENNPFQVQRRQTMFKSFKIKKNREETFELANVVAELLTTFTQTNAAVYL